MPWELPVIPGVSCLRLRYRFLLGLLPSRERPLECRDDMQWKDLYSTTAIQTKKNLWAILKLLLKFTIHLQEAPFFGCSADFDLRYVHRKSEYKTITHLHFQRSAGVPSSVRLKVQRTLRNALLDKGIQIICPIYSVFPESGEVQSGRICENAVIIVDLACSDQGHK